MSRFPVNILFESIEFAIPATFKNKAGVAKDIFVVFDDSFSITQIGETGYVNENPVALCSAKDVKGICKGSKLAVHNYVDDENDDLIRDLDGDPLIATNLAIYNVMEVKKDADGFIDLQLSLN